MKILGIDPGITKTGWALIQCHDKALSTDIIAKSYNIKYSKKAELLSFGTIKTDSKDDMHKRLAHIYNEMSGIIRESNPDVICVEITIVNVNPKTSIKLAEARGAIMTACGVLHSEALIQIPPNVIKKTISGDGHCDKKDMVSEIAKRISNFPEKIKKDEIDALCCAYVGYSQKST